MMMPSRPVGELLREWRQRRSLSQLDLAMRAEVSARHVSFLETGRSSPSRDMLLHLAEELDVPLRERNALLMAAGFAPAYPENSLEEPQMKAAREAVELVLSGHEPYPALAVDRHWHLVTANRAVGLLLEGIPAELLTPPLNVLRLSLHPEGLAPNILNLEQWRAHILARLHRQAAATADAKLAELLVELRGMGGGGGAPEVHAPDFTSLVVPLRVRTRLGVLSFISTTTVFGTPRDITLSELAIESFFPADAATGELLRKAAEAARRSELS
ncbi:helix-turn-helix domain-containing protein [Myxococcus stipitatus]|nr:helix-turn-helix transcriptional regulator [Myxococcus stipitatus]